MTLKSGLEVTRYLAFSFLCTFVPGSEKSIEITFAPVELSFRGTFAPGERKVNFRFMELSHPWNVRSTNNFRAL